MPRDWHDAATRSGIEGVVRHAQTLRGHADEAERRALMALQLPGQGHKSLAADDLALLEDALRGLATSLPAALSATRELRDQLGNNQDR